MGAQAEVYKCKIKGMAGKFVDKVRKVFNNAELAERALKEMFSEYVIAKDLIHKNIVEYKYFMRKFDPDTKNYEFHIILELMDGDDMEVYIKDQGRPFTIGPVKSIGGQLISSIKYLHECKIIH
jgi:serine/threonine protein kinase